jgi:hypothetical protein
MTIVGLMLCHRRAFLERSIASLRAHTDRILVGLDSEHAEPGVAEALASLGVPTVPFTLRSFAAAYEALRTQAGGDWHLILESDEEPAAEAGAVRALADRGEADGVHAWQFRRRHWLDLDRHAESPLWPDDWCQARLLRAGVTLEGPVHWGLAPGYRVERTDAATIASFGLAIESDAQRHAKWVRLRRMEPRATVAPPYPSRDVVVAPTRHPDATAIGGADSEPWRGVIPKKPWEYRVTAVLPHLDTPELLHLAVEGLRRQSVPCYIMVIDGGSLDRHWAEVDQLGLSAADVEAHRLDFKSMPWMNWSIAVAMDLAFAACRSEYLLSMHTDVFLRSPHALAQLLMRCDARTPAVGWRMSSRAMDPTSGRRWRTVLGHALTLYHMPTMRRARATWSMAYAGVVLGLAADHPRTPWPDVEAGLALSLEAAGIGFRTRRHPAPGPGEPPSVLALGVERNGPHRLGSLATHHRSGTLRGLFGTGDEAHRAGLAAEVAAARERYARWRPGKPRPE